MKIAYIQFEIKWESAGENHKLLDQILSERKEDFDLLVLPEMFNTGFSMNTHSIYEDMEGPTMDWMKKKAIEFQCVVTGSIIIKENDHFYNRLIWMRPDETYDYYDKRHLFSLAKEDDFFTSGKEKKIFEILVKEEVWRICPQICYDLRFPVWSRNVENYDLLLYVANWPEKREFAWSNLLKARAIENQCYVVGVNRVGIDGKEIPYSGQSVVLRYDGKAVIESGKRAGLFVCKASKKKMKAFRRAYNFLADRDQFTLL